MTKMTKAEKLADQAKFRFTMRMSQLGILDAIKNAKDHKERWEIAMEATNNDYQLAHIAIQRAI